MNIVSNITWKGLREDKYYSSKDLKNLIEEAYLYLKTVDQSKICFLWKPSVEAIVLFIAGMYANKKVCYYTVPNSILDERYFSQQMQNLQLRIRRFGQL